MDTRPHRRSSRAARTRDQRLICDARIARGVCIMRCAAVQRRPWGVSAAGGAAALALHLAFLSVVSLGASAGRASPSHGQATAMETPSATDSAASVLVFIDRTVVAAGHGPSASVLRMRTPRLKDLPVASFVRLSTPELGLSRDDEKSESLKATATTAVDGAERAMLFGRYINQIVARVDRAWVLPQSGPNGASHWGAAALGEPVGARSSETSTLFHCRVQVRQSRNGEVLEVTLLECDSSPEWQQSLVNAIDAASPLPAPPNQSVFARSLVLNFTSAGRTR
jgi:hypothetical protein